MRKVIIIGAGPAGLTAAYELLKSGKDHEVIILEETSEIGGISRTVRYNENRMDIGGHRFFSKDERVTQWWTSILPIQGEPSYDDKILGREKPLVEGGPDPEQTDHVMLVRDRVSRIYYLKAFFDYPISMKFQTFKNMGFLKTFQAGFSYLWSVVFKKKETSLENFYINRFGKVLYSMFFEGYTEKLWGRHPSEISADWGAQRVKGLSIRAVLKDIFRKLLPGDHAKTKETSLIEQFIYPKLGPGQLWETVAQKVEEMGGRILKGCSVKNICCGEGKVNQLIYTSEGEEKIMEGDCFISSMPLKDLVLGIKDDNISEDTVRIAKGLPYRDFITVGLLVNKLNLKNKTNIRTLGNIVPDCWIYVQEENVKIGRLQIFNNWSPYMVKDAENTVWIGLEYFCNENDEYWNMPDEKFIRFAAKELESMGIINPEDILDCHRENVKKAYPAYFDTYNEIDKVIDYINGIENLYCVGRYGQHRYNNMDHSMVTAFETVHNILNDVKSKDNIWNVNTDKEYHEKGTDTKQI